MLLTFWFRRVRDRQRGQQIHRVTRAEGRRVRYSRLAGVAGEILEVRCMLSGTPADPGVSHTTYIVAHPYGGAAPYQFSTPTGGFTPQQIAQAYGINQIQFGAIAGTGAGQTIAIVDAYDNPKFVNSTAANFLTSDLHQFDVAFGLPDPPSFKKVDEFGGQNYPPVDPTGGWEGEESLDVEWAHAIAPMANIILVETIDPLNLFSGVRTARNVPGVSVISMSFGQPGFLGETALDSVFTTPAKHTPITFLASSGDTGAPGGYPAESPNVVAVGGTSLYTDATGNYQNETGWGNISGASGGGISQYETKPIYQIPLKFPSGGYRTIPDVSFVADPETGVDIYDSYNNGAATPWGVIGGTSLASPSWAGLIAIADQGRVLAGEATLDGAKDTLPILYKLPASDFHDITTGYNGFGFFPGYNAGPGYDLVTGIGTPVANKLVPDLVTTPAQDVPPVLTMSTTTLNYVIDAPATVIDPAATITDTLHLNYNTGTLTVNFSVNGLAEDRLAIQNQGNAAGQIGISANVVSYGGLQIGTFIGGTSGQKPLTIAFNANATPAAAQALLDDITYQDVSQNPLTLQRTIQFVLSDGQGGSSTPTTVQVNYVPPLSISPIPDDTVAEGTLPQPMSFTVSDLLNPVVNAVVSAASSNGMVVTNPNLIIAGAGAARTLAIIPNAFGSGTAVITLSITDPPTGISFSQAFKFIVTPLGPPTISTTTPSPIVPLTDDQQILPVPFSIGDPLTPVNQLTVSATSSNLALLPNANLSILGSGANQVLAINTLNEIDGVSVVTLTVTDLDGRTATLPITVDINSDNDAPTISTIPNQTSAENSSTGGLALYVADADTPANQLSLSATSSNQALLTNANFTFFGNGNYRQISAFPTPNVTGSTTITVTVADNTGGTAQSQFQLTVIPSNIQTTVPNVPPSGAPTISSVATQSTVENTPTSPIPFTIGDLSNPSAVLTVTAGSSNPALIPNANLLLAGGGANRTISLVPAANQTGSATITLGVYASDGTQTTTSFVVTVTASSGGLGNSNDNVLDFVNQPLTLIAPTINLTGTGTVVYAAANLPAGAAFDPSTRTLTWTPAPSQGPSTNNVIVTATNGTQSASETLSITVYNPTRMYQAYNASANLNFFTTSYAEFRQDVQIGLQDKSTGQAGFAVDQGSALGALPLHRLYDPNNGLHYYTASNAEETSLVASGWVYERDEGYLYTTQVPGSTEIFRLYNSQNGDHIYTASAAQSDAIVAQNPAVWQVTTSLGFGFAVSNQGTFVITNSSSSSSSSS